MQEDQVAEEGVLETREGFEAWVTQNCISRDRLQICIGVLDQIIFDHTLKGLFYSGAFPTLFNNCRIIANRLGQNEAHEAGMAKQRRNMLKRISKDKARLRRGLQVKKRCQKLELMQKMLPFRLLEKKPELLKWEEGLLGESLCYICKDKYRMNGQPSFYAYHCEQCSERCLKMRNLRGECKGKVGLVTGGRARIGFMVILSLLESGAKVYATTRFPAHFSRRVRSHQRFREEFREQLVVCQLDLYQEEDIRSVCQQVVLREAKLDFLINNAAQTIRKPPSLYANLVDEEKSAEQQYFQVIRPRLKTGSREVSLFVTQSLKPRISSLDSYEQTVSVVDHQNNIIDLRPVNSWTQPFQQIQLDELKQCLKCNAVAPFILIQQLLPALSGHASPSYIVNVTAMEGIFSCFKKPNHVHTNMAKAALNMLTRTMGAAFKQDRNIRMTAVDTGWVTNEKPLSFKIDSFEPPLDEEEGAARILHPLYTDLEEVGCLLKNYETRDW